MFSEERVATGLKLEVEREVAESPGVIKDRGVIGCELEPSGERKFAGPSGVADINMYRYSVWEISFQP